MSDHTIFQRLHRQFSVTGSFYLTRHEAGRRRAVRSPSLEESILNTVADRHESSTRAVTHKVDVSHHTVCRKSLTPIPFSVSTSFESGIEFVPVGMMQQSALQPDFIGHVLFTDEATFSREGVFNTHNSHLRTTDSPHPTRSYADQQRFWVNV